MTRVLSDVDEKKCSDGVLFPVYVAAMRSRCSGVGVGKSHLFRGSLDVAA